MENRDFGVLKVRAAAPLRLKARVVCARCNNRWMSRLEAAAQPILRTLIRGLPSSLTPDNQETLAAWSVKTAYMFRYAVRPVRPVPQPWRDMFYADRSLPPSTHVWFGRYGGDAVCRAWTTPLILKVPSRPHESREGELFTLALGQAVMQVAFIDYDGLQGTIVPPDGAERLIMQIWPTCGSQHWPPPMAFTDTGLEDYSRSLLSPNPLGGARPEQGTSESHLPVGRQMTSR